MTKEEIIKKGLQEVGVHETGQNYVKYNDWFWGQGIGGSAYPWCAAFLSWLYDGTGVDFPRTASCAEIYNYAFNNNKLIHSGYDVGDVFIYSWNGTGFDHCGLVLEKNGAYYKVLEGNQSDAVTLMSRTTANVVGAYRPDYSNSSNNNIVEKPKDEVLIPDRTRGLGVAMLQGGLKYLGYNLGWYGIDGDAGLQSSYTNKAVKQAVAKGEISKATVDFLVSLQKGE